MKIKTTYFSTGCYGKDGIVQSRVFRSLRIRLAAVFNYPIDPGERVVMVKEGRPPYGKGKPGSVDSRRAVRSRRRPGSV